MLARIAYDFVRTICPLVFAAMLAPMRTPITGLLMRDTQGSFDIRKRENGRGLAHVVTREREVLRRSQDLIFSSERGNRR